MPFKPIVSRWVVIGQFVTAKFL